MNGLITTRYERQHREALLNLMFYSRQNHTHLDWYRPAAWLDMPENHLRIAWQHDEPVGFMGMAAPLSDTTWIRLAGVHSQADTASVLMALWHDLQQDVAALGVCSVSILAVNRWIEEFLSAMGFQYQEDVVTLYRNSSVLPALPDSPLTIREAFPEDVAAISAVDHAAFMPRWQLHSDELRQAIRLSASSTVALYQQDIIGYQVSTRHHTSGHLARLAVLPENQGQQVGAALLDEMMSRFMRRGVRTMTVNTQADNARSLKLYERYEFRRNGFDLPVWTTFI